MSSLVNKADGISQFKLTRPPDPPGQIRILVSVLDGKVIVDFNQVVQWVGLEPEQVENLIGDLQYAVRSARTLHVVGGTDEQEDE